MVQLTDHEPRVVNGKKPKPLTEKLGKFDITGHIDEADNFSVLHRKSHPSTTVNKIQPIRFEINGSANNTAISKQKIRDDLARSPKGVELSESRLSYLVKAKQERKLKILNKKMTMGNFAMTTSNGSPPRLIQTPLGVNHEKLPNISTKISQEVSPFRNRNNTL